MPLFRCTWFFEGLQAATIGAGSAVGWTETWALNQPSADIDQAFFNPDVVKYLQLRQNCLSAQYRISFLRIGTIQEPGGPVRRFKVAALANVTGALGFSPTGGSQVQCAILVDGQKLPLGPLDKVHHRKFLVRGLPSDVINGNVVNNSAASWNAFTTFFNFIANRPTTAPGNNPARATMLGLAFQDFAFPKGPMPAITVDALSPRLMSFPLTPAIFVPGEQIRVNGWSGIPGVNFNRSWTYISTALVGPTQIHTFGKSRFDMSVGTTPFPNAAQFQRTRYLVGPLDQYAIIGLRSKRTGRVFHQLRGRSGRKVRA